MDSLSKQELISTISKQAEQVKRYESRLRDVVTAYKGLAKEKEALEISLKALNKPEQQTSSEDDSVSALTLSLSTLSAEKSRMEEAFQSDKKVTREKYENVIAGLREENKNLIQQHQLEVNNLKAKIGYEIQEREKERADHSAMMKELQMKLNMELVNKDKMDNVTAGETQASKSELEKRVRDLSDELEATKRRLARSKARTSETPALLVRLQEKMALLEQTHSIAIREEQIKAMRVEEWGRRACAAAERRAGELEAQLAELSRAAAHHHARRRKDEATIRLLQDELNRKLLAAADSNRSLVGSEEPPSKSETDNEKLADSEYLQTLIDKIHILKKELVAENEKLGCPVDIHTVFKLEGYQNIHSKCREEYEKLQSDFDTYVRQNAAKERDRSIEMIEKLNSQISGLKAEVEVFKNMIDEEREEKVATCKMYEDKLKSEKDYHAEVVSELKERLQNSEKQVQTHRERYAILLSETDSYLRERKAHTDEMQAQAVEKDVTPAHMLHYAQEMSRRERAIAALRREKHTLEGQYRDIQRDSTIEKERFKEVMRTLKEEIDRLRRAQSREGANLEYLKNVVYSYIVSSDYAGRKHMLNAIAAVLHFTDNERNSALATL